MYYLLGHLAVVNVMYRSGVPRAVALAKQVSSKVNNFILVSSHNSIPNMYILQINLP